MLKSTIVIVGQRDSEAREIERAEERKCGDKKTLTNDENDN